MEIPGGRTAAALLVIGALTGGAPTGRGGPGLAGSQLGTPEPLVVYLEDGPWIVTPLERNGAEYLPLVELVRQLALPYTDATAAGFFTIRGPLGTVTLERETAAVTIDGTPLELDTPVLNEDGRWLVPIEFLSRALPRTTGVGFTSTPSRIIASNVETTPLEMEASAADGVTRLIIRLGRSSNVRVQQNRELNVVTLNIDRAPLVPELERLTYRDAAVRSVAFNDLDGHSHVVVETTPQVANVRLVPSDENRTFLLELVPTAAPPEAVTVAPAPSPAPDVVVDTLAPAGLGPLRVLVIDPGHGGLDSGTRTHGVLEKDLTLRLARRLQATLEQRRTATIILTRQVDRALDLEDRSIIANQSRADFFISIHVGYSPDPTESGGSVFVMKSPSSVTAPEGAAALSGGAGRPLFVPWHEAWRTASESSLEFAGRLAARLESKIPEWPFMVRKAPLAVLASVTMPGVVVELGNANNEADLTRLADPAFQNRVIDAIIEALPTSAPGGA